MTVEQFKAATAPSIAARAQNTQLRNQLTAALNARANADAASSAAVLRIVNGVKGDPDEGDNGQLYEAMGYIRKSGLKRSRKAPAIAV